MSTEQNVKQHPLDMVLDDMRSLQESLTLLLTMDERGDQFLDATRNERVLLDTALSLMIARVADLTDEHEVLLVSPPEQRQRTGFSVVAQGSDAKYPEGFYTLAEMLNIVVDAERSARTDASRASIPQTFWCDVDPCSDTAHPDYSVAMCGDDAVR